MKDLLSLQDISTQELLELLELGTKLKQRTKKEKKEHPLLKGKHLG